jgi:thymidylate synthase (FAD)
MKIELLKFTDQPERICAIAARICYSASSLSQVDESLTDDKAAALLKRIIASGHHSVLEHASFTFGAEGISRVLLAQLTRHRIASFSVQSQRYVEFKDGFDYVVPKTIKNNKEMFEKYERFMESCQSLYQEFLSDGIAAEDARYVLPNGAATKIIFTMNARELRHFFALRCCNRAQWEIREMACEMLVLVKKIAPIIFDNAGPSCVRDGCHEDKPCGSPWEKK